MDREVEIVTAPPFFSSDAVSDSEYLSIRDHESRIELRETIERLWQRFFPYCANPSHFLSDARCHFHQRIWEMYLACLFLEQGFSLKRPSTNGPDIKILTEAGTIWIEAAAPTSGTGPDAAGGLTLMRKPVPSGESKASILTPETTVLRYTSSLRAKLNQYIEFRKRNIVGSNDVFVVAINAGKIDDADIENGLPDIIRAVFPIGEPVFCIPLKGPGKPYTEYRFRPSLLKKSGSPVSTDCFLDPDYKPISAVIFAPYRISAPNDLKGTEIIVVHNPNASVPLPPGIIRLGREYWLERNPDVIRCKDRRRR